MEPASLILVSSLSLFLTAPATAEVEAPQTNEPEKVTLQITTGLGVEKTIQVGNPTTPFEVLRSLVQEQTTYKNRARLMILPAKITLELADKFCLMIPLHLVQDAEKKEAGHTLKLTDNRVLQGRLRGAFGAYDFDSISRMRVLKVPQLHEGKPEPPKQAWTLEVGGSPQRTYTIVNPRFAIRYYTTDGYAMGGTNRNRTTTTFYVKVGEEEHPALLTDFSSISMPDEKKVIVRAESGVETEGGLALKAKDSRGFHYARLWMLVGEMLEGGGTLVAVGSPGWTLSKQTDR